ncbi:MAG: cell wall hydrolase, partial [Clostridiales bacterium]|nr:cell wall hydrolase [Clostridiales bacterium]
LATGGEFTSKIMVAGVVLNRTKDSHFPDTIYDVVWQDSQFQPTTDGRIYSCTVTESTIEAVDRVLAGEDYSQGALYFVARGDADTSNLSWFDSSLAWLFEYGGHDFYTFQDYVS